MSQGRETRSQITVIKIGGSVLINLDAYRQAARYIVGRLVDEPAQKFLVVVSAQEGVTDSLLDLARQFDAEPDPALLDLLWATGEHRSVATLSLCLHGLGIAAAGLNVHETGLVLSAGTNGNSPLQFEPDHLRDRLDSHDVVIVPGFLARRPSGAIVSLGRGGSDFTAVQLAADLQAGLCELVKDVPGYFTRDPNRFEDARPIPTISFEKALEMAAAGCELVQQKALLAAAAANVPLVIHSLDESLTSTWIA